MTGKSAKNKVPAASLADFMRDLEHPLKLEIEAVRVIIRDSNAAIEEGIKWNAPSFHYKEWFATANLRNRDALQIILHLGAKARDDIEGRIDIRDPNNLLQWLGKDRASVTFTDMRAVTNNSGAFQSILVQWLMLLK